MRSFVDGKFGQFQSRYGKDLGFFLIRKLAEYEGDFLADENQVYKYLLIEKGNTDEAVRVQDFNELHKEDKVFHTYVTHLKYNRTFNLLISYN